MTGLLLSAALAAATDTLVVGTLSDPVGLEPHRATDLISLAIVANVCETLVRFPPGRSRPEAALATTWATADQREWTFTLREGVHFHDGAPLDAEAVVVNLEHLRRERGFPGRGERVGPYAVAITLDRSNAALLSTLSQAFFALQSPRRLGNDEAPPVGTGPFRFRRARPGLVELEANEGYWGGSPRLRRVRFRRLPNQDALIRALVTGEVDVTSALDQTRVAELRSHPEVTLDSQTGLSLVYLALNNERAPLDDRRVRQALARGLDREALTRDLLQGHGEPAHTPLPPSLWGHDTRSRELVLDRTAARRLLAQASMPGGFATTITVSAAPRPYLPDPLRVAARLREDLAQIGVALTVRQAASWREQVELTSSGEFEMALLGWQADTLDPNDFLTALLDSGSVGSTNRSRYRSPAMDALLKRARMGSDLDTRLAVYREVQDLFQKDMPFVPIYYGSVFTAHRRQVGGLVLGPTGIPRYDKAWKAP